MNRKYKYEYAPKGTVFVAILVRNRVHVSLSVKLRYKTYAYVIVHTAAAKVL